MIDSDAPNEATRSDVERALYELRRIACNTGPKPDWVVDPLIADVRAALTPSVAANRSDEASVGPTKAAVVIAAAKEFRMREGLGERPGKAHPIARKRHDAFVRLCNALDSLPGPETILNCTDKASVDADDKEVDVLRRIAEYASTFANSPPGLGVLISKWKRLRNRPGNRSEPTASKEPCRACGEATEPRGYFLAPRSACLDGARCLDRQERTPGKRSKGAVLSLKK